MKAPHRFLRKILIHSAPAALFLLALPAVPSLSPAGIAFFTSHAMERYGAPEMSAGYAPRLAAVDWEMEITVPLANLPKKPLAPHEDSAPGNTGKMRPLAVHRDLTGTVEPAGTIAGAFTTDDESVYYFETDAPAADILYSVCPVGSRCRFTAEVFAREAEKGEYWLERILAIENLDQAASVTPPSKGHSPGRPREGDSPTAGPERETTPASSPVAVPAQRIQPSFDCARAATLVERLICDNEELSAYDAQMAQEYAAVMRSSPRASVWKKAHVKWFHEQRNTCENTECLRQAYIHWIGVLRDAALE